jgi:hypothetical protein
MTCSSLSACALVLALAVGVFPAADAAADEGAARASASEPSGSKAWIDVIPVRCVPFASVSLELVGDRPASDHAWTQLLSLAACAQDGSLADPAVTEPGELAGMVEEMSQRLALPMLVYLDALENGDAPIQLRAAFQIGMAYVGLSTRARSSIAAPADLAASAAAASRYHELHARLEPLLATARRAAWISFRAIDEAAAQDPALAGDEVERHMIRTARLMLPALRDAAPEDRSLLVRLPR